MRPASNTLAECERPMIKFIFDKCGRRGQYRKATLVDKYGPDVLMPDLLRKVAGCSDHSTLRGGCPVRYDLTPAELDELMGR
jgi:hypothetical protein